MPITRTPIFNDDGSGTLGTVFENAWKQQLYDQIDAFVGGGLSAVGGTVTAWIPVDASGGGLALLNYGCAYVRIGKMVFIVANVSVPANASAALALIGGLPFANIASYTSGFYTTHGITRTYHLPYSSSAVQVMNPTTGAQYSNQQLVGASLVFAGFYFTA